MPAMAVVSNRPRISPVAGLMEAIEEDRAAWELIPVILPELSSAAPVFLSITGPGKSHGRARTAGQALYAAPGFQKTAYPPDTIQRPWRGTGRAECGRSQHA